MGTGKTKIQRRPKTKPAPMVKRTRWEKSADRANERLMRDQPLFVAAGLVPLHTPEQRQATIERGHALSEASWKEREDRIRQQDIDDREIVRTRVSAEKFVELEADALRRPAGMLWRGIIQELERAEAPPGPAAPPRAKRRLPLIQVPMFVELTDGPTKEVVPLVVDGKILPRPELEAIAAREPAPRKASEPRGPCPDCGWVRSTEPSSVATIASQVHPPDCPSFRGMLLGFRERCEACRGQGDRVSGSAACEVHRARVKACLTTGVHIPGPPDSSWSTTPMCTRCGLGLPGTWAAAPK